MPRWLFPVRSTNVICGACKSGNTRCCNDGVTGRSCTGDSSGSSGEAATTTATAAAMAVVATTAAVTRTAASQVTYIAALCLSPYICQRGYMTSTQSVRPRTRLALLAKTNITFGSICLSLVATEHNGIRNKYSVSLQQCT